MSKILVVGAAGFVGRNLVEALVDQGHEVIAVDINESVFELDANTHKLDIRTDHLYLGKLATGVDIVYHLANIARVEPSWFRYNEYYATNVTATQQLLQTCQQAGVKTFVYLSSSSVYGAGSTPQREDQAINPCDPYSVSKAAAEMALRVQASIGTTKLLIARPFNMYGRGQANGTYSMALGKFLNAYRNGKPLQIHGTGEQRRDLLHISDAVNAFLLIAEKGQHGEVYNVGSGSSVSIKELAEMISGNHEHVDARLGVQFDTLADISKIQALGFIPHKRVGYWLLDYLTVDE